VRCTLYSVASSEGAIMRIYHSKGNRTLVVLTRTDVKRLRRAPVNSKGEICFSSSTRPRKLTRAMMQKLQLTPMHR
jgi:hypothetical protein